MRKHAGPNKTAWSELDARASHLRRGCLAFVAKARGQLGRKVEPMGIGQRVALPRLALERLNPQLPHADDSPEAEMSVSVFSPG
jgi:hypothetical protein